VRLDHLLSREIRVLTRGGVGALMAPKVDRTVDRSPLSGGWRRRFTAPETDRDPTKTPITRSIIRTGIPATLHVLRVQPPAATDASSPDESAAPGGRLAQLVRALP
jgi:hypothetical protein